MAVRRSLHSHRFSFLPKVEAGGVVNVNVNSLFQKANIYLSPRTGTFQQGSTFQIPVFIDTQGGSINTIDLRIKFDQNKLTILQPAGNKSIIALWIEPPSYSNSDGTMKLVGVIPGGLTTKSGLITTITFKALDNGDAGVYVEQASQVLANDGMGTVVDSSFDTGLYTVVPKPPEGMRVFSETHSFPDKWYNNDNPVLSFEKPPGVTHFSYVLDDKPFTIPDDIAQTEGTTVSFPKTKEGVSYFHLKAMRRGVWGGTTHFLIKIDATPPAEFKPNIEVFTAAVISSKALISFFTTDALSGVDHYEVGVIKKSDSASISPVFFEATSPYQLPMSVYGDVRVIVRAFDKAGNARDEIVDANTPSSILGFLTNNIGTILLTLLLLLVSALFVAHYLFGHHILFILERAVKIARLEEARTWWRGGLAEGEETLLEKTLRRLKRRK